MDPGRDADRRIGGPGEGAPPNSAAASEESAGRAPGQQTDTGHRTDAGQRTDAGDGARVGNPAGTPQLSLRHAAKAFGAVHAIVDGSIDLYGGEVHGLVGENGAGKSTLVKILAGVYQPDSGELLVGNEPTVLHGPAAARDAGIAVIYQEPTLFPDLTAAENIFMGRQPLRRGRRIDAKQMREHARRVVQAAGCPA